MVDLLLFLCLLISALLISALLLCLTLVVTLILCLLLSTVMVLQIYKTSLQLNDADANRVDCREVLLTPLQTTDQGGTITMVTASGRSFTIQIKTEDIALQETNPATPGQLVLGN